MKGVEYIMLEDKAYQIKARCGSDGLALPIRRIPITFKIITYMTNMNL